MTLRVVPGRFSHTQDTGPKREAADPTHKEALEATGALPVPLGIWET